MEQTAVEQGNGALALTVAIIKAFVANNSVPRGELANLIASVVATLRSLGQTVVEPEKPALQPPVPIKKSVTPGYLISLEDGRQYKSLKRHLSGRGLTPDQYREKWGLPANYPMVAPEYAAKRSELARSLALGRKRYTAQAADPELKPEGRGKGRQKASS